MGAQGMPGMMPGMMSPMGAASSAGDKAAADGSQAANSPAQL